MGNDRLDFVALMSSISSVAGYPANLALYVCQRRTRCIRREPRPTLRMAPRRLHQLGQLARGRYGDWFRAGAHGSSRQAIPTCARRFPPRRASVHLPASLARRASVSSSPRWTARTGRPNFREPDLRAAKEPQARINEIVSRAARRHFNAPPSTETEHALAAIWTELLGVEQVATDDNFFLLGGHSLMATRALVRIKDRFGANLVLRDIFDAPTLAQLSVRIDEAASSSATAPSAEDDDREEMVF